MRVSRRAQQPGQAQTAWEQEKSFEASPGEMPLFVFSNGIFSGQSIKPGLFNTAEL